MKNVPDLENKLILFRGIAKGDATVLVSKEGDYVAAQCKSFKGYEDYSEMDIIGRLQYEMFGEFPLSPTNQTDWDNNISKALNLSDTYRKKVYHGEVL